MLRVRRPKNSMFVGVVSGVTGLDPQEGVCAFHHLNHNPARNLNRVFIESSGSFRVSVLVPRFSRNRTGYDRLAPVLTGYHDKHKSRQVGLRISTLGPSPSTVIYSYLHLFTPKTLSALCSSGINPKTIASLRSNSPQFALKNYGTIKNTMQPCKPM